MIEAAVTASRIDSSASPFSAGSSSASQVQTASPPTSRSPASRLPVVRCDSAPSAQISSTPAPSGHAIAMEVPPRAPSRCSPLAACGRLSGASAAVIDAPSFVGAASAARSVSVLDAGTLARSAVAASRDSSSPIAARSRDAAWSSSRTRASSAVFASLAVRTCASSSPMRARSPSRSLSVGVMSASAAAFGIGGSVLMILTVTMAAHAVTTSATAHGSKGTACMPRRVRDDDPAPA